MVSRVLVTGATGFLGGAVLRRLIQAGTPAIGQGRNPVRCAQVREEGLDCICWTLPEALPLEAFAALGEVDAVIHCAALSSPFGSRAAFEAANVRGTQAMLDLARQKGVKRFVFVSSPSIYFALRDQLEVTEDSPLPKPFNAYARSKVRAEALVRKAQDVGPIILRPRGLYGPKDTTLLPRLLRAARRRPLPQFRDGRASIDLTFIEDATSAVCATLAAPDSLEGRAYNISGGEVVKISEIVEQTCARADVDVRWRPMPLGPALLAARLVEAAALMYPGQPEPAVTRYGLGLFAFEQSLNLTRARSELGWEPEVSFAEGLRRTFVRSPA
ncbi:MAG: NAD(P)-dependent oxidoreductase [Pseudomonadota bacterium]